MNFRSMLSEKLNKIERFRGFSLGEEVTSKNRSFLIPGYLGYVVEGIKGHRDAFDVTAGIIIVDGAIHGVYYSVGELVYRVTFVSEKFLDEIAFVMEQLVSCLQDDHDVGNERYLQRRYEDKVVSKLRTYEDLANKHTGDTVTKLHCVLVDTGYEAAFMHLLLGYAEEQYVLCLAEQQGGLYRARYERYCETADEANAAYSKIKKSKFVSKKGNTVYKVNPTDFSKFYGVTSNYFLGG